MGCKDRWSGRSFKNNYRFTLTMWDVKTFDSKDITFIVENGFTLTMWDVKSVLSYIL